MTSTALKIVALIAMTIDHIGVHLITSPQVYLIFRIIGRLAMPLFCFLIAEGYRHTSNRRRYFFRLFGFATFLEACFALLYLLTGENYLFRINIFLTLSAGLACLILVKSKRKPLIALGFLLAVLVLFLDIDYGIYAVLLILLFGLTEDCLLYAIGLFALNLVFLVALPLLHWQPISFHQMQWFSMAALIPIFFYNKLPGKGNKTFFYLYYPLHLLIILGIKELLLRL
ncbi:MAG: traX [Evtepia sp.]|jgi:hypothetical protein|nr:traX [Evtepia sp.]